MISQFVRCIPVIVLATSLAACSPQASAPAEAAAPATTPISPAAIEQNLQDTVAALVAGDAARAGGAYDTDAVFLNARGRYDTQAGIQAFWEEALKSGAGKDLVLEAVKSGTSGDLAYTVSRFTGGVTASSGYTMTISERKADGSIKIIVQMSLPDPPARK